MKLRGIFCRPALVALAALSFASRIAAAQGSSSSSGSPTSKQAAAAAKSVKKSATPVDSTIESGAVSNGVYRNKSLALSCKIPPGWVLRTDEMNAREEAPDQSGAAPTDAASSAGAKVLLAVFSRPPAARAEDVNASIVIAAESVASYPELKEAAQYFFPLNEVAKAQGFSADEDPYDIAVGTKKLVRGDFHKNVGTRVMHQSTLVMLSHGYAISITVIGGTDDEVEDLIDGLSFSAPRK
jgi:hypothetical protein